MKILIPFIFLFSISIHSSAQKNNASLFAELNKEIDKKTEYLKLKEQHINAIRKELENTGIQGDPTKLFKIYLKLWNEYKSFKYDSAFAYACKLQETARLCNQPALINLAKIDLSFVLLSSGLFTEALDTLKTVSVKELADSSKISYYAIIGRTYNDLSEYCSDRFYSTSHTKKCQLYLDSAISLTPRNSFNFYSLSGFKNLTANQNAEANQCFEYLLKNFKLEQTQIAVITSSLGHIAMCNHQSEKSTQYYIQAAIADIRSSTKEAVALQKLAGLLYESGNIQEAYTYIKLAMDDANFYQARQRQKQIASILPIIEHEAMSAVRKEKRRLLWYSVSITLLSLAVVAFFIVIFKQLTKLKESKRIISESNLKLEEKNEQLSEANRIKEEYIGYYFNINSEYIHKLDQFKKAIQRKLTVKRIEDIENIIHNIDPKKEREELYAGFDKVFLKLFPDFINQFNQLFPENDRVNLKDLQLMNTDLRIFALIRLGIDDNEKIAKILNYSVNTIYAYKTKVKNKSLVPNEQFEDKVMAIK